MKINNFIKIFLATIIIIRVILYLTPRDSFIYTNNFHHIYIGIFLLIIYKIFKKPNYLLQISLGLITDQITQVPFYVLAFFIQIPRSLIYYWSPFPIISTIIAIIIAIVLIKKYKK